MHFLWKSQLRNEKGKLLPRTDALRKKVTRKERLETDKETSFFGVGMLWGLLLGTVVYVVFFSPYLLITASRIDGTERINKEFIDGFFQEKISGKYFGVFPKNNFFLVRPKKLEAELRDVYPLVKAVSVARVFPHGLQIAVTSREKVVRFCTGADCYQVLEDGSVSQGGASFESEEIRSRTLTVRDTSGKPLRQGAGVFPTSFFPFVTDVKGSLKEALSLDIEDTFTVSSRFANELRMKTSFGWEIYVSTERPFEDTLGALTLLFEKEVPKEKQSQLKYVDLRTENRIYYVFQEGTSQSVEMTVPEQEKKKEESDKKKDEKKKDKE